MIKYINSYSLFLSGLGYWDMIPLLIRMHHSLYDHEWEFVIHHDRKEFSYYYGKALEQMNKEGIVRLVAVNEPDVFCKAMLWRMKPIWDSGAEYVFCRDADSLLTARQKACVQEFINSGKGIHGINDNDAHNIPLMGGMIGVRSSSFIEKTGFSSFDDFCGAAKFDSQRWESRGADQELLMDTVWSKMKENSIIHRFPSIGLGTVEKELINNDERFCAYIGACGIKTSIKEAIDFYNHFVPEIIRDRIDKIEKETIGDIYVDNFYNK